MTEVFIPTPAAGTKMAWNKLKDRQVYDFALVSVAAVFTTDGGNWKDGRITLGGVAPVPYRATGRRGRAEGQGHQGDRQGRGRAAAHRRAPDEPERATRSNWPRA